VTGDCTTCGRPEESHPGEVPSRAKELTSGRIQKLANPSDASNGLANSEDVQGKPLRAVRIMKARRTKGTCPLCQQALTAGRQIGLVRSLGWCHAACVVVHNRQISTEEKT